MSEIRRELAVLAAPYRREIRMEDAEFESGMHMLRMIIREGHRITQVDLDADTARALSAVMLNWAGSQPGQGE